jgi:hypothetical protein
MKSQPSGALAELLARDGELDRILEGRGLTFERKPSRPPPPPPPSFEIPKPDWAAEERERRLREIESPTEPDPPLVVEDTETAPRPRQRPEAA